MSLLVVYVTIALAVSFLCSILEAVLLSVSPAYLAQLEQERPVDGKRLRALKTSVDRPLGAILSLNTIAHTIGAAGAGAQAQHLWGSEVLTVASVVLTLLILVLSEIIPKTLGAVYWRALAPTAARILQALVIGLYPLVLMAELITRSLARGTQGGKVDRAEIAALARLGADQGLFDAPESRILRSLFRFQSIRAQDIMTPRTVVVSAQQDTSVGDAIENDELIRFSRIPIWSKTPDNVDGYVLKDALLLAAARGQPSRRLSDFRREIVMVADQQRVSDVLQQLLERTEHIAMVANEFGDLAGVVTLEDVVETLLGMEIVDEVDTVEDMRAMARNRWFERARKTGMLQQEALDVLRTKDERR